MEQRQDGFTLIEALIASMVMAVGVAGLMAMFPQSYLITRESGRSSVLNHLATEKAEYLRSIDYAHSDLSTGTHPSQVSAGAGTYRYPVPGFPAEYSVRWIVSAGPTNGSGTAVAGMKTVVIEATYLTRYTSGGSPLAGPRNLTVVLRTFVTD